MISTTRTMPPCSTDGRRVIDNGMWQRRYEVGRALLGPVFYEFCHRLWLAELEHADGRTVGLYVARGGLRLGHLYESFLTKHGLASPVPHRAFFTSRLAAIKTGLSRAPELVAATIAEHFAEDDCRTMMESLLPRGACGNRDEALASLSEDQAKSKATPESVRAIFRADSPCGEALRRHFAKQEALFDEWMGPLTGFSRLLMIDTGWSGSTQATYMRTRPQWQWVGLHFGRWNYGKPSPPHFAHVRGLMVDSERDKPDSHAMSLLRHRLLIEMPLEPAGMKSVEYYLRGDDGQVRSNLDPEAMRSQIAANDEAFFAGIQAYFAEMAAALDTNALRRACESSLAKLSGMIRHPDRATAELLTTPNRSEDFGKSQGFPMFCQPTADDSLVLRWRQVCRAAWPEGQAVISFPRRYGFAQTLLATQMRYPKAWRWIKSAGRHALKLQRALRGR